MKVLFASDGSPYAKEAARYLCGMHIAEQMQVTLLTVSYDPAATNKGRPLPWHAEWRENEQKYVSAHQNEMEELFGDNVKDLTKLHRTGNPIETILRTAEGLESDLIVVGAVGHSLLSRVLLGSVSDEVATRANCSVLVVRPSKENGADKTNGKTEPHPYRITIGYDGSPPSKEAVQEMVGLKWRQEDLKVDLVTVAVRYDYMMGDGLSAAVLENEREMREKMQREGQQLCQDIADELPGVQSHVVNSTHVGDAIVLHATKNNSDMIVVGDAGHGFLYDVLMGSTTKYILRHSPCSVWVSRHHLVTGKTTDKSEKVASS